MSVSDSSACSALEAGLDADLHEAVGGQQAQRLTDSTSSGVLAAAVLAGAYLVWWSVHALMTGMPPWYRGFFLNNGLAAYLAALLACIAVAAVPSSNCILRDSLNGIAELLSRRGTFQSDARAEAPKFALIRIVFGAFLVVRSFWILYYLEPSDWADPSIWLFAISHFVASVLVMLGLGTQPVLAYLILVQWTVGDIALRTSTLGNYIASMLSFLLLFANAGKYYSIDAFLLRRDGITAKLLRPFYYSAGPCDNTLQIAKLLVLFMYWGVCLYSLAMHLNEPAWMTGTAGPLLLTNKFMASHAAQFEEFFQQGSWEVLLGRISLWAMLPWYVTIVPFAILGGIFRSYVITWAILFFLFSKFILQLGWLSEFEFLMLAALFWQSRFITGRHTLEIFYDDKCNLCDRTVRAIQALDWFERAKLRPASKNKDDLASLGIAYADALADLHAIEGGKVSKGYEFYVLLTSRILLLLPFYPVLLAGRHLGGPQIYRAIAARRIQWFGECKISVDTGKTDGPASTKIASIEPSDPIVLSAAHVFLLGLVYIVSIPTPYFGPVPSWWLKTRDNLATAAFYYGMGPINVFNRADLHLSENWFTLTAVKADGTRELLPILAADGTRLAMHRSDRVYFGETLQFRREAIGTRGCLFNQYRQTFEYLSEDARRQIHAKSIIYTQYRQPLPDDQLIAHDVYKPRPTVVVCSVQF